jgi:hypothetical protein
MHDQTSIHLAYREPMTTPRDAAEETYLTARLIRWRAKTCSQLTGVAQRECARVST